MSAAPYGRYKYSDVAGLDNLPEHWTISRLAFEAWVRARLGWKGLKSEEYTDEGYALLATPNIKGNYIDFINVNYIDQFRYDESPEIKLSCGDVLLAKDGSTLGTVNVVRKLPVQSTVNSSIAVITPYGNINSVYLYYLFQSSYMSNTIQRIKGGMGVPHLFQADLSKFKIPLPPTSEQIQIAAFLDRETAKIVALVEEQKRLIELLNEKVGALVLSTLDSTRVRKVRLGVAGSVISRPVVQEDGVFYTALGLLNRGRGLFHKDPRDKSEMGDSDFYWIEEGDFIISGQFAWEGAVALAGKEETGCVVSHRYPVLRGKAGEALTEYLYALFLTKHGTHLLGENSRGAAGRNRPLNINSLMKETILLPDLETQTNVARAVHWRSRAASEITEQVALLNERKIALISAAVTGKIDVRGIMAEEVCSADSIKQAALA